MLPAVEFAPKANALTPAAAAPTVADEPVEDAHACDSDDIIDAADAMARATTTADFKAARDDLVTFLRWVLEDRYLAGQRAAAQYAEPPLPVGEATELAVEMVQQ